LKPPFQKAILSLNEDGGKSLSPQNFSPFRRMEKNVRPSKMLHKVFLSAWIFFLHPTLIEMEFFTLIFFLPDGPLPERKRIRPVLCYETLKGALRHCFYFLKILRCFRIGPLFFSEYLCPRRLQLSLFDPSPQFFSLPPIGVYYVTSPCTRPFTEESLFLPPG